MPTPKVILGKTVRDDQNKRTIVLAYTIYLPKNGKANLVISRVPKDTTKENYNSKPRLDMSMPALEHSVFYFEDEQLPDNKRFSGANGGLKLSVGSEYKIAVKLTAGSDSDLVISSDTFKVGKQFRNYVIAGGTIPTPIVDLIVKSANTKKKVSRLFITKNNGLDRVA